jgi:hypothetical protein
MEFRKMRETQVMRKIRLAETDSMNTLTEYVDCFEYSAKVEYKLTTYFRKWKMSFPEIVIVLRIEDYFSDDDEIFYEEMHLYDLVRIGYTDLLRWFRSYSI